MQIAAVVVTHSRPELLPQVIDALQRQSRPIDNIVVVDNACDAASLTTHSFAGVTVCRSEINLGGAGGFALGMKQAYALGADWIWLLDDDAVPRRDALSALLDSLLHQRSKTGALCGSVLEYGKIAVMHRRRFERHLGIESCIAPREYLRDRVAIDTGSFVGFLVRREAINAAGFPNPDFFLSYDDTEYSLRLKASGFELYLVPGSVVEHLRSMESRLRYSEFGRKHYFNVRNRIHVKRSYAHFGRLSAWTGIAFGIALWASCKGRFRWGTSRILLKAIADGYSGRLGPYPESLESWLHLASAHRH